MNEFTPVWGTFTPDEKNTLATYVRLTPRYLSMIANGQREPLPKTWDAIIKHPMVIERIAEILDIYNYE